MFGKKKYTHFWFPTLYKCTEYCAGWEFLLSDPDYCAPFLNLMCSSLRNHSLIKYNYVFIYFSQYWNWLDSAFLGKSKKALIFCQGSRRIKFTWMSLVPIDNTILLWLCVGLSCLFCSVWQLAVSYSYYHHLTGWRWREIHMLNASSSTFWLIALITN